jgi:hypothetical protein
VEDEREVDILRGREKGSLKRGLASAALPRPGFLLLLYNSRT